MQNETTGPLSVSCAAPAAGARLHCSRQLPPRLPSLCGPACLAPAAALQRPLAPADCALPHHPPPLPRQHRQTGWHADQQLPCAWPGRRPPRHQPRHRRWAPACGMPARLLPGVQGVAGMGGHQPPPLCQPCRRAWPQRPVTRPRLQGPRKPAGPCRSQSPPCPAAPAPPPHHHHHHWPLPLPPASRGQPGLPCQPQMAPAGRHQPRLHPASMAEPLDPGSRGRQQRLPQAACRQGLPCRCRAARPCLHSPASPPAPPSAC